MTIKQKQCLLAYLGYYTGAIDGIWGAQSQSATEAFQRDYQLTVDGEFGDGTAQRIREVIASGEAPAASEQKETAGTFWEYNPPRHFTRKEFRCPCGVCGGFPVEPQEAIVRAADDMREALGVPVIIVPPDGHSGGSGVRCQAYNDSLSGSVKNSRHVLGKAVDFSAPGASASAIEAYLAKIRANGTIRYWYKISTGSYHMDVA